MLFWEKKPVKEGKKGGKKEKNSEKKKKNCFVLICVIALILLLLAGVLFVFFYVRNHYTHLVLKSCLSDQTISEDMTVLSVPRNRCNDKGITVLDFTRFKKLKRIEIGDESFRNVDVVKLIEISELESVVIGHNCFKKSTAGNNPSGHFYLKNCPKNRVLRVGRYSFSDYDVIEIENVKAMEGIEMNGNNFQYASLELKSFQMENE